MLEKDAEKLMTPVKAFIIFNDQEGFDRCEKYFYKWDESERKENPSYKKVKFLGDDLDFSCAPDPSNIIWENQSKS